jgi:hypothetical protein
MLFWIVEKSNGTRVGCEMKKRDAIKAAESMSLNDFSVYSIDVPVCADSIRRLLGNLGGYANGA